MLVIYEVVRKYFEWYNIQTSVTWVVIPILDPGKPLTKQSVSNALFQRINCGTLSNVR